MLKRVEELLSAKVKGRGELIYICEGFSRTATVNRTNPGVVAQASRMTLPSNGVQAALTSPHVLLFRLRKHDICLRAVATSCLRKSPDVGNVLALARSDFSN